MKPIIDTDEPVLYQFKLKGRCNASFGASFDGFRLFPQTNDETFLVGPLNDPTELQDLLVKIRQLGLPLSSIQRVQKKNS